MLYTQLAPGWPWAIPPALPKTPGQYWLVDSNWTFVDFDKITLTASVFHLSGGTLTVKDGAGRPVQAGLHRGRGGGQSSLIQEVQRP